MFICYEKDGFVKAIYELTDEIGGDIILDSISGLVTKKVLIVFPYMDDWSI